MVVSSGISQFIPIREYICGQIVQNLTNDMQLEMCWMQRFGRRALAATEATWFLDDINIWIWNGTSLLQVLSEDFNRDRLVLNETYSMQLGVITMQRCGLGVTPSDRYVEFRGGDMSTIRTRRSIRIISHPIYMLVSSDECSECKLRCFYFGCRGCYIS